MPMAQLQYCNRLRPSEQQQTHAGYVCLYDRDGKKPLPTSDKDNHSQQSNHYLQGGKNFLLGHHSMCIWPDNE